ncbi:hypothetical protein C475_09489 [Halosimplex carlsbadense 2-9-1]|uniref:DUF2391 domain-containing protein n=1 Tax=Halosimplex carlsbadense 2-9-1 TaxID=797114 RepID=M0CR29_9EURY|nr:hypothetical protein C475_09489 [Halosimplex carlsbadense 2-9-1]
MSDRQGRPGGGGDDGAPDLGDVDEDDPDMGDLFDELAELEETVDSEAEREQVRETMRTAMEVQETPVFGRVVFGFDRSDAAEALLGSLLFGIPMFVEGGTYDVGLYLSGHPFYFLLTNALTLALVTGILYVADFQDVRVYQPIFGFLPRKFLGVLTIPLVTAAVVMTVWGMIDWTDPWLAVCQVAVALVPMSIGAALGDLLPG